MNEHNIIMDERTQRRNLERERVKTTSSLNLWALSHRSAEDRQLIADVRQLLHLTETISYRADIIDGESLARAERGGTPCKATDKPGREANKGGYAEDYKEKLRLKLVETYDGRLRVYTGSAVTDVASILFS